MNGRISRQSPWMTRSRGRGEVSINAFGALCETSRYKVCEFQVGVAGVGVANNLGVSDPLSAVRQPIHSPASSRLAFADPCNNPVTSVRFCVWLDLATSAG